MTLLHKNEDNVNLLFMYCFLIIAAFFSFASFDFLNIFNIKKEVDIFILLFLIPISSYLIIKNKQIFNNMFFLLMLYLFISSFAAVHFKLTHSLQLLMSILAVLSLLSVQMKYINFIIKNIIYITFFFSIIGIILFVYYQIHPEILINMSRSGLPYEIYLDKTNLPLDQKFGFVIESPERNLFGISYVRSRSYFPEPSVSLYMFFSSGILSLLYNVWYKIMGFFIFIFGVILIYPGAAIVSLLLSLMFVLFMMTSIKARAGSIIILIAIISIHFLVYYTDFNYFSSIVPSVKSVSFFTRFSSIDIAMHTIFSNIIYNNNMFLPGSIGLFILFSGIIPLLGISLIVYVYYVFFKYIIRKYTINKLFISLVAGLLIEIAAFSSLGWGTLPGFIMFTLFYKKVKDM